MGIDPQVGRLGERQIRDRSRAGHESGARAFCIDPALDCTALEPDITLRESERLAACQADLLLDEVDARHHFRDRVFHLQPCVHFDEVELAGPVVEDELDRARILVAGVSRQGHGRTGESSPHVVVDGGRRGLFNQLLVSALHRAVPLPQLNDVRAVADDLHLHMADVGEVTFQIDVRVAECTLSLRARGGKLAGQFLFMRHDAHPPATTAGGCLEQDRVSDPPRRCQRFVPVGHRCVGSGNHRNAQRLCHLPRRHLVPHEPEGLRTGADECDPLVTAALREARVLREESVTRVDGVAVAEYRGADDGRAIEVALPRLCASDTDRAVRKPDRR